MSVIHINQLTFGYDGSFDFIFEQVSLALDTDWKLGFIGRNGRGKTTFFKLLMGKYEYRGSIQASVSFDYFPFEIEDDTHMTLDIVEQICKEFELWALHKEFTLLGLSQDILYRPFATLSHGEKTKVMLAALFLKENRFLLLDEPTNHLDAQTRKHIMNYLNQKSGFILVSHDREFLDGCIDHVMAINKTNIEIQKGNFSSWWENKIQRDTYELEQNHKLKKQINQLNIASRQTKRWSDQVEKSKLGSGDVDRGFIGHKAAKMMKRSQALKARQQKAMKQKESLLKDIETVEELSLRPLVYPKKNLVSAKNLSIRYGGCTVFDPVDFVLNPGDRIALKGKNGSGKSSILKLIMGENIAYQGMFSKGSNLIVSYIPQDTSFLHGDLKEYAKQCRVDESLLKAILRKLDFSRIQFEKDMGEFSAGQKKKVLLAKSLCEPAHLYVWDEPLNFIDIYSRMQIEDLLLKHRITMIFVEHDSAFANKIATKNVYL